MPIDIDTIAVVQSHPSGRETVVPMAELGVAAHGTEAKGELRLYLESHLSSARAETRASFSSATDVSLRFTMVELPHQETPKRHRLTPAVSVASLTAPGRKGTWVIVLPLSHTFWVDRGDDIDEAIREETKRIAAARVEDPWDYLRLLPPEDTAIERLVITLATSGAEAVATARKHHKRLEKAHARKNALAVLASIAEPFHDARQDHAHPPVVGRARELASLDALLSSESRASVLLVGDELAGKSALFGAWFDEAERAGRARPVYRTSAARLLAGMSGLGQWQSRVSRVLEAIEVLDAILYFDSLGELFGDRASGGVDIPGVIKRFLDEDRIRVLAEIQESALDVLEPRNAGFFAALTRVRVAALDAEGSGAALEARRAHHLVHEPDRPRLTEPALGAIVHLTDRYLPYLPHPGKAVRLYDEVRAAHDKDPSLVGMSDDIDVADVELYFGVQTGIPRMLLGEAEPLDLSWVEERLRRRVIGQDRAVRQLVETVAVMKAALSPADKPLGVFLFVGPTGVGKTELARALAELVFGSEARLSRFDMSEYGDADASMRLIRGDERRDGLLTRAIRQEPFGIVLLDEIEKAHPAVYDLLLGALGEARLSDARGRTAFLHNTIVIMTSNVGARSERRRIGIGAETSGELERFVDAARAHFRPEFLNRLDRIVPFHPLGADEIHQIARIQLRRLESRRGLAELGAALDLGDGVIDRLAERGYSEAYGARALRRTLEDELVVPMAELLCRVGGEARGATIRATLAEPEARSGDDVVFEGMRFALVRGEGHRGMPRGQSPFHRIAQSRRALDVWYHLPPLERLREQIDFLVAQMNDLSLSKKPKARRRAATLLPKLGADHHRLSELSEALTTHRSDLTALEELAFASHLAGTDEPQVEADALDALARFRALLPRALVALLSERDAATFIVRAPDAHGGLTRWLLTLFDAGRARGYQFTVHVPVSLPQPGLSDWPEGRFWGPPQSSAWLAKRLAEPAESVREVLLSVKGPYAGALLALEAGIHRWLAPKNPSTTAHLSVVLVAMRAVLSDADHASKLFRPTALPDRAIVLRMPAVREHDPEAETLTLRGGDITLPLPDDYWAAFDEIACEHLIAIALSDDESLEDLYAPPSSGVARDADGVDGEGTG